MDILNSIRYQVEKERAGMPDNGLNESPGILNSFLGTISGASQEGVENKRSAMRSAADKRQYGDIYTSTTGKAWRDGMTGATAMNEVNEFKETKQDNKDTKNFERSLVPMTKQLEAQTAESRLNRESQSEQFRTQLQTQENRFAYQDKQNRLDRGLERELAGNNQSMQLALGQMNADLADKRMEYDRETRRMDKRSQAIAQLMSGLGSLGGAFSL
jgi:hypothetical protein